ncbi:MAG: nucleotide exchange factor GrpE [Bacteroidales bacterium]|jgi:molecular chaperone GrpE|nr:nucleotide exchange factor GrpE [Bacteroidales bacterium]
MTKKRPKYQDDEIQPEKPVEKNEHTTESTENNKTAAENAENAENATDANSAPTTEEPAAGVAELQEKYLRLAAEFDNFRKRTLREKMELMHTAGEALLKNLLPVVDDFERGLTAIDKSDDIESIKTGMSLIYNKLLDFLSSSGVVEIKASGETFDADRHEAVTKIPAPSEDRKGKIIDVIQKGYVLHEKIIRYPKVVVGE